MPKLTLKMQKRGTLYQILTIQNYRKKSICYCQKNNNELKTNELNRVQRYPSIHGNVIFYKDDTTYHCELFRRLC